MFHSAELRWFFEGDLQDDVRQWFEMGTHFNQETPRTDGYLLFPRSGAIGVKFRRYPGKKRASFEIKPRTSDPLPARMGKDVEGYIDTWVKWTCDPSEPESFEKSITAGKERWVFVKKCRCLRKYSFDASALIEVDATSHPTEGCQFELTEIKAAIGPQPESAVDWRTATDWWSLSFEAFGQPSVLREYVARTGEEVFSHGTPVPLELASSISYPVWMQNLTGHPAL